MNKFLSTMVKLEGEVYATYILDSSTEGVPDKIFIKSFAVKNYPNQTEAYIQAKLFMSKVMQSIYDIESVF
jgi:hypothetical protein